MSLSGNYTDFSTGTGADNIQGNNTIRIMVTSWMSHYISAILSDPFVKKWFGGLISWLMTPVVYYFIILFIMPAVLCLFVWFSSLLLYIHRVHKRRLMRRLTEAFDERDIHKAGRHIIAAYWDAQV